MDRGPSVVVITMVRDEAFMLPRWLDYYGRQVGVDSLVVLDDNSTDGSTADLPCPTYRLPPPPWKKGWGKTRLKLVSGIARGFLACTDFAIYTDVDEFLVPDPDKHTGLLDYLAARPDPEAIAPLALEVLHNDRLEGPLDPGRPLLEQRRFVKFARAMCKPLVKRTPVTWDDAFHAVRAPYEVDRDLWMVHLKYADVPVLEATAEKRRRVHEQEGRGHPDSFWPLGAEELKRRLQAWTEPADATGSAPLFEPADTPLDGLVEEVEPGVWRSPSDQVGGLDVSPLCESPLRIRSVL